MRKIVIIFLASIFTVAVTSNLFAQSSKVEVQNKSKSWLSWSLVNGGVGGKSNFDSSKIREIVHIEFLTFTGGFDALGGLGFGSKIYEVFGLSVNDGPLKTVQSFLPIYACYPIFQSVPYKKENSDWNLPLRKHILYLSAGFSFWPALGNIEVKNYQNYSITYNFTLDATNTDPSRGKYKSKVYATYSFGARVGYLNYTFGLENNKSHSIYGYIYVGYPGVVH